MERAHHVPPVSETQHPRYHPSHRGHARSRSRDASLDNQHTRPSSGSSSHHHHHTSSCGGGGVSSSVSNRLDGDESTNLLLNHVDDSTFYSTTSTSESRGSSPARPTISGKSGATPHNNTPPSLLRQSHGLLSDLQLEIV